MSSLWVPPSAERNRGYVSEKHRHLAELVNEFDPDLHLVHVPADQRQTGDPEFAVVHRPDNAPEYVAFYAETLDERIIARLYTADNERRDPKERISSIEAHNAAVNSMKRKEQEDARQARVEFMSTVFKSPKSVYRHGGREYR